MVSTVGRCINLLECSIVAIWKWHQIVGMCINMSSFGSLCLVVVKISLVPFFCGKMRQNLLMERKYASTVGMCINLLELASMCWNWDWKYHQQLESASTCWNYDRNVHPQLELASIVGMMIDKCINNWKVHQLLECGWKLPQQWVCGINLLEWQLKMHQQLECASIVGMWHQHLEGASNVGIGLETDLCGFKFWLLTPCWYWFLWGANEDTSDSVDSFICSLKYVLFTGMGYGQ